MVVRFHVVAPVAKQRTFSVRLPILLGRSEEAKFRIQHDLVSRKHCELFERQGQVYVRDLGSTNGTFLNDEQVPVSTKTIVPPGGIVRVGGLSFAVEYQLPAANDATGAVDDEDRRTGSGVDESRVEGNDEPLMEEQPDFQVVHQDDVVYQDDVVHQEEESPAIPQPVVFSAQSVACAAGAADAALADTDEVRPPEATGEPTGEPTTPAQRPEGFDFLSSDAATTTSADAPLWPSADNAAADVSDDDELNSFFKGLK